MLSNELSKKSLVFFLSPSHGLTFTLEQDGFVLVSAHVSQLLNPVA